MRVNPYYSKNPSDPSVHHVERECPTGKQIPAEDKRFGTNGYPKCKQCAAK